MTESVHSKIAAASGKLPLIAVVRPENTLIERDVSVAMLYVAAADGDCCSWNGRIDIDM